MRLAAQPRLLSDQLRSSAPLPELEHEPEPADGPPQASRSTRGAGWKTSATSDVVSCSDWLVWQLVDSAFPTGGYAHSNGLEAAWQHGEVRNAAEVVSFIDASLQQSCYSILPFVSAAHAEPNRLLELDELCDAFTTNHVANRASRLQGCAWAAAVARIFPDAVKSFEAPGPAGKDAGQPVGAAISLRSRCGHFAPVFGASTRFLGLPRPTSLRLLFFHQLRGLIAAAVRLNIVGGMEAQRIQQRLSWRADDLVALGSSLTLDDIAQTAPLLDVWQGAHDRLYSRLFQS